MRLFLCALALVLLMGCGRTEPLPSVERDGGAGTVNATGAVYRLVTDFSDLDRSLAIIAPGQSGQPESPYYDNLLEMWGKGETIELPYTRTAVSKAMAHRLLLKAP